MSGIELLALRMARRIREENEEVDRINALSNQQVTSTNTTNRVTLPKEQPAQRSTLVLLSLFCLIVGVLCILGGSLLSLPYLAAWGLFDGLAAATFAILSLRETR